MVLGDFTTGGKYFRPKDMTAMPSEAFNFIFKFDFFATEIIYSAM